MRRWLIPIVATAMVWGGTLSTADTGKGAKDIVIPGGGQGSVKFPHQKHQEVLKDCMLCHDLFPQQAGSIQDLKQKGTLTQKQIMNKQCLNCHRSKKESGEKSGPVMCKDCHA